MNIPEFNIIRYLPVKTPRSLTASLNRCISLIILASSFLFFSCESQELYDFAKSSGNSISVTSGNMQLYVSWKAVEGATAYELWYNTTENSATALQFGGDITATSYTITGLTNGTVYYIWIKAKNAQGIIWLSETLTGIPAAALSIPSAPGPASIASGNTTLFLTWTAVPDATGYEVWCGTVNDSAAANMTAGNVGVTNYTITGLVNGTLYYVWLKAKNTEGTSGFSVPASGTPGYSIGDTGPGGGIVFYVTNGGLNGLEAAPSDQSSAQTWTNSSFQPVNLSGTSTAIGTGLANSDLIVAQNAGQPSAAKLCRDYAGGGLNDWFLPSKDELNELYLQRSVVGSFSSGYYWSSSQNVSIPGEAWGHYFTTGLADSYAKGSPYYVRAIRAF